VPVQVGTDPVTFRREIAGQKSLGAWLRTQPVSVQRAVLTRTQFGLFENKNLDKVHIIKAIGVDEFRKRMRRTMK